MTDTLGLTIDEMGAGDWPTVARIYQEGMETGNATFEQSVPDWSTWDKKMRPDCRLVVRLDDQVVGWAALSPVSVRAVYAGVAEVSIYIAASARGQGVGKRLLTTLVAASEAAGVWTLQAGIFPENEASIALHRQCGFRVLGVREKPGQMHGRWRDVVLMERRSQSVGRRDA